MHKSPPSKLEDHLGYWLRCLSNYVHHSFSERLEKFEVSVAQWVVLRALYEKNEITLNGIAAIVGVDKSSLSRTVERLVQKNLVDRIIDNKDRRSVKLSLSKKGKELVPLLAKAADENDNDFFRSLAKEEHHSLCKTVQKLLSANGWEQKSRGWDTMQ